jgi:mono/diheme cytochrome c family protein
VRALPIALAALAIAGSLASALAAAPKPPARVSYTADQAWQGRLTYLARCAECHAGDLHGQHGPALAGDGSNVPWQTPLAVWQYMTAQMPVGDAGGLPDKDYLAIMAFILKSNGMRPGRAALTKDAIARDTTPIDGS